MGDENKLSRREFGALVAAAPLAAGLQAGKLPAQQRGQPVKEAAPIKARPFPLGQVRLLSGSCYTLQDRNRVYLHTLDPDRLLHTFRLTAGLPSKAQQLGGWERPDIELRGPLHGPLPVGLRPDVQQHRRRAAEKQGQRHRRRAGQMPEGQRQRLALSLPHRVHAAAEGAPAGVGALLHPAQDHGRHAGHVPALRQRAGPGHCPRHGRVDQEVGRPAQRRRRWPASCRSSTAA